MTYLDNAATSFPKPRSVVNGVNDCLKKYCGNPGRSAHYLSQRAAEEIYAVREKIQKLIDVNEPENIVFTQNATHGLNLAIKTIVQSNCHVLCSNFEHNAVIRPLNKLKRERGIEYSTYSSINDIESLIKENTCTIISSISSNVTGRSVQLKKLSDVAKKKGIKLIIDASQAIGHTDINISDTPCDALCAPGHKALFGIQGSGFVYFKNKQRNESFIEGGSGFDSKSPDMPILLPEAYEAGTLSTPAIVSLGKGIDYINSIGVDEISSYLNHMTEKLYDRLSNIPEIKIYGYGGGILAFNYKDFSSTMLSSILNEKGICVRGGLHCAPLAHESLGTLKQGVVRVSFSYLNKSHDVDRLYNVLKRIV